MLKLMSGELIPISPTQLKEMLRLLWGIFQHAGSRNDLYNWVEREWRSIKNLRDELEEISQ